MPHSDPSFDEQIKELIETSNFENFLDIGPGAGKYGKMIRSVFPDARIEAVEVNNTYIQEFNLTEIYDNILNENIGGFIEAHPDYKADLVIIGDCIEHLRKSVGVDLINYFLYRSKKSIVVFPHKYVQYSWQGNVNEAHISVWSDKDFENFDFDYYKNGFMRLSVVTGYLADKEAVINPNAT